MPSDSSTARTTVYRPALAWFAAVGGLWVFVLVTLGAFTTSIGAGMVFPDWPLSNGSVNPEGWLDDVAMFAEHSHRLSGTLMGLITIVLAVWLWRVEARGWMRQLGYWALVIVVIQGLLGGTRVLLDDIDVPGFTMSLGQILRIPHGILAQIFVCLLIAIALALSRPWLENRSPAASAGIRRLAVVASLLLLVQLTIAAIMRHNHAGLAIPTFPFSSPEGGLLPPVWSFPVTIHFAHRLMALVITIALAWLGHVCWRSADGVLKAGALLVMIVLALQVTLGAYAIWSLRDPYVTTAHVIVGALLFAGTFGLACWTFRPVAGQPGRRESSRGSVTAPGAAVHP